MREVSAGGVDSVRCLLALIVLMAPAADAFARGGPLHLYGPFDQHLQTVSHAGSLTPSISPILSCGRGRYRDPIARKCVGPADVLH